MTFSVVTLSKDDPAGLARTLASLAAQQRAPEQIVVVPAGNSRDQPLAPGIVKVDDPGGGIAAAFNAAIVACRGEWLVFLNGGDALLAGDSLQTLAAACESAGAADIVACRARTDTGDRIPWRAPRSFCDFLFLSHQATAFRRRLFEELGPYDETFHIRMDLDWLARYLLARGEGRIAFVDRDIVDYTMDGISSTSRTTFYAEEFRVLTRSAKFLPALLGLLIRRLPERAVRESWRLLTSSGAGKQ